VLAKSEEKLDPPVKPTRNNINPSALDIFHYCFCYVGVLTGPYFTYKTYNDFFKTDFGKYAQCEGSTLARIVKLPLLAAVYLLMVHYFPLQVWPRFYMFAYIEVRDTPVQLSWDKEVHVPMFHFRLRSEHSRMLVYH